MRLEPVIGIIKGNQLTLLLLLTTSNDDNRRHSPVNDRFTGAICWGWAAVNHYPEMTPTHSSIERLDAARKAGGCLCRNGGYTAFI